MIDRRWAKLLPVIILLPAAIAPILGIATARAHVIGPNPQTFFGLGVLTGIIISALVWQLARHWRAQPDEVN